jgi:hypothetical protein
MSKSMGMLWNAVTNTCKLTHCECMCIQFNSYTFSSEIFPNYDTTQSYIPVSPQHLFFAQMLQWIKNGKRIEIVNGTGEVDSLKLGPI